MIFSDGKQLDLFRRDVIFIGLRKLLSSEFRAGGLASQCIQAFLFALFVVTPSFCENRR
jgi:hypothetical protein